MKFSLKQIKNLGKQLSNTSQVRIKYDKTVILVNKNESLKYVETENVYKKDDDIMTLNIFDFKFTKHLYRFDRSVMTDTECAAFLELIRENKVKLFDEINFFSYNHLYEIPVLKYAASKLSNMDIYLADGYPGHYDENLSRLDMDDTDFDVKTALIRAYWTPSDFLMLFNMIISNPKNMDRTNKEISEYVEYLWRHMNLTFKSTIEGIGTPSEEQIEDEYEMLGERNYLLHIMFSNISTPFICKMFATHYNWTDDEEVLEMMYEYCTNRDTLDRISYERSHRSRFEDIKFTDKMESLLNKNYNRN